MIGQSQISCNTPTFLYSNYICEILLYNWQLVVITHELIYGVRVLSARGKIIVKQVYCGRNRIESQNILPKHISDTHLTNIQNQHSRAVWYLYFGD